MCMCVCVGDPNGNNKFPFFEVLVDSERKAFIPSEY